MTISETHINILQNLLNGFSFSGESDIYQNETRVKVERESLPIPQLIFFLLNKVMQYKLGYRHDKMHWILYFLYDNKKCAIALEKFGLRLYLENKDDYENIIKKINKAVNYIEKKILQDYAKEQMKSGNLTISNHFNQLSNMYYHFKEEANKIYNKKEPDLDIDDISIFLNSTMTKNNTGFYNTFSMIEAYFSRFEHFLAYCLFFNTDRSLNIYDFYKKDFSEKFKIIFPLNVQKNKLFYDEINIIKEKYRNTFSHGMFSKNGEPFYFQLDNAGMIPANLSKFKDSPHFNFVPTDEIKYEEICEQFDKIDNWLEFESSEFAWKYAGSGLSLSFSSDFFNKVSPYLENIEDFQWFIDTEQSYRDMIENADY